jgi:RNA polymerase sigma factor (sigma-70 family)
VPTPNGDWISDWQTLRDPLTPLEAREVAFERLIRYRGNEHTWWPADRTLTEFACKVARAIAWGLSLKCGIPFDRLEPDGEAAWALLKLRDDAPTIRGSPSGWLYTVIHHNLVDSADLLRKPLLAAGEIPEDHQAEESVSASKALQEKQDAFWRSVDASIEELSPAERTVAILCICEEMRICDAARLLGKKPNTVSRALKRAVEKLGPRLARLTAPVDD